MRTIALFNQEGWAQDDLFPHSAWQEEVAQGSTRQGYAQWLASQYDQEGVEAAIEGQDTESSVSAEEVAPEHFESFPEEDWETEVKELSTRLGYVDWVAHQVEANLED